MEKPVDEAKTNSNFDVFKIKDPFKASFQILLLLFAILLHFNNFGLKIDTQIEVTKNATFPAIQFFGEKEIFAWHFIAVSASIVIDSLKSKHSLPLLGFVYVAYDVLRIVFRHYLNMDDAFDYWLHVGRIFHSTFILLLWRIETSKRTSLHANKARHIFFIITSEAVVHSSASFDVAFSLFTHDNSSFLIDVLHLIGAIICFCIYTKQELFSTPNQSNSNNDRQEKDENKKFIKADEKFIEVNESQNKQLPTNWIALPLIFIISYTYLVSTFLSPNNPLRNAFIHHYSADVRSSGAYISGFYGISLLMGSFISRYLREYNICSRFSIASFMLFGHIFTYLTIFIKFKGTSFEAMVVDKERFWLAFMCVNIVGFCLAGINAQLMSYYVQYFHERSKSPDKIFWAATSLFSSLMFYFKMNSEEQSHLQFSVLCLAASITIAFFYFIEPQPYLNCKRNDTVGDVNGNGQEEIVLKDAQHGYI